MKIHPVSDVHNEFSKFKYNVPECDVVICAGDIHPGVAGIVWAAETYGSLNGQPVIYVAGNHEFYGKRALHKHYEKMREKADNLDVHFLQNKSVIIDGVKFIGCTLWTDFNLYGNQVLAMIKAQRDMNDYQQICSYQNKLITPEQILVEHQESFMFLQDELNKDFDGPTVIVTHHGPSEQSCAVKYSGHPLNPCYASRLDSFVDIVQPTLWVHGHVHSRTKYSIGETQVIVNPRGYPGEKTGFNPNLVLDV